MFKSYRQYAAWEKRQLLIGGLNPAMWFYTPHQGTWFFDYQIRQYFNRDLFLKSRKIRRPKRFTHQ